MTARSILPALAGALLLSLTAFSGAASGGTLPKVDLCHALAEDLRLNLMLVAGSHPAYGQASQALTDGSALCGGGNSAQGIEVLTAGIASLGLPVRPHGN